MQIRYIRKEGLILLFTPNEFNIALLVLKAIYRASPTGFIAEAIRDIENDLQPKQLPIVNYWHLCRVCNRDLNERDDNAICITKDNDVVWKHKNCLPLKDKRPI